MIHVYCGDGKGKTTAATGLCIRGAGSGKKILFVQFLKDGTSSEIDILDSIKNVHCLYYPVNLGFCKGMDVKTKTVAKREYQALFDRSVSMFQERNMDILVLDEMLSAYNNGMIDRDVVIEFLSERSGSLEQEVILTGRNPDHEILRLADYVSEIKKIKHPYDRGISARKGIEY